MNFEFDPAKSETNKQKNEIDFTETQILWNDPDLLVIQAKTIDEKKF